MALPHILIVDDEPDIRHSIRRILNRTDRYTCDDVGSVDEALAYIDRQPVSLILCDMRMPGRGGVDLLRAVSDRIPDLGVVMVTAAGSVSTAVEALQHGAYGYVLKPFLINELLVQVEMALRRRELELSHRAALGEAREEMLLRLATAAEFRDNVTGGHIQRMSQASANLATLLGWAPTRVAQLRLAAALHDVGKIAIPDQILLKPGRFTPEERRIMETHTTLGAEILSGSDSPAVQMAERIALSHHERWDGEGYPQQLAGDAIPIEARIVAIMDVYDALSHSRPYKQAWPEERVLGILREGRGKHFDPDLVDVFFLCYPDVVQLSDT